MSKKTTHLVSRISQLAMPKRIERLPGQMWLPGFEMPPHCLSRRTENAANVDSLGSTEDACRKTADDARAKGRTS